MVPAQIIRPAKSSTINCNYKSKVYREVNKTKKKTNPYNTYWVSVNAGDTFKVNVNGLINTIKGPATVKMVSNDTKLLNTLQISSNQPQCYSMMSTAGFQLETSKMNSVENDQENYISSQSLDQHYLYLSDCISGNTHYNTSQDSPFLLTSMDGNQTYLPLINVDYQNAVLTRSILISYLSAVPPPAIIEVDSKCARLLIDNTIASVILSSDDFALCTSVDLKSNGKVSDRVSLSASDGPNGFKEIYRGTATEIFIIDLKPASNYTVRCRLAILSKDSQLFGHHSMCNEFTTEPDVPDPPEKVFVHIQSVQEGIKLTWMDCEDNGSPIEFYTVEISTDNGINYYSIAKSSVPYVKLHMLSPLSSVCARVSAINDIGSSKPSGPVYFTVPCKWRHRLLKNDFLCSNQLIFHKSDNANDSCSSTIDNMSSDSSNTSEDQIYDSGVKSYSDDDIFSKSTTSDSSASQTMESRSTPSSMCRSSISLSQFDDIHIPFKCECLKDEVLLQWDTVKYTDDAHICVELEEALSDRNRTWILPITETSLRIRNFSAMEWNVIVKVVKNEDIDYDRLKESFENELLRDLSDADIVMDHIKITANNVESDKIQLEWTQLDNCYLVEKDIIYLLNCVIKESNEEWCQIELYKGHDYKYTHENLSPNTEYKYNLHIQKINQNDSILPRRVLCDSKKLKTLYGFPESVTFLESECVVRSTSSVDLKWRAPENSGGCPIKLYKVYKDKELVLETTNTYCSLYDLLPNRTFGFQIRAVNQSSLHGEFSRTLNITTPGLVFDPPTIISINSLSWNSATICWNAHSCQLYATNDDKRITESCSDIRYRVELVTSDCSSVDIKRTKLVYNGHKTYAKICKLREDTSYIYRVQTTCSNGESEWSNYHQFKTKYALPMPILIAPRCKQLAQQDFSVQWTTSKQKTNNTEYILEIRESNEDQFRKIYHGSKHVYRIKHLNPNTTYQARVWSKRKNHEELISSVPSPLVTFTTGIQKENFNQRDINSLAWTSKFSYSATSAALQIQLTLLKFLNIISLLLTMLLHWSTCVGHRFTRLHPYSCIRHVLTRLLILILLFFVVQSCSA